MKQEEWSHILPPDLVSNAYRSANQLAWPAEDALRVIRIIEAKGMKVTTIEPWLATQPGPSPLGFDWYYTYYQSKPLFPKSAVEFIEHFEILDPTPAKYKVGKTVVFNLSMRPKDD